MGNISDSISIQNEYIEKLSMYIPDISNEVRLYDEVIGKGSEAIIKKGLYKNNDVAIKIINISSNEYKSNEIEISCKLSHLNTVRIYGFVTLDKFTIGLTMEYFKDGDLHKLIHKTKSKSVDKRNIISSICRGLIYLHDNGIIHRDIKSKNVLVNGSRIALSDYGTAKYHIGMTVRGTFAYIAPEILKHETYDKTVDIYSFGVLIWEILNMRYPLESEGFPEYKGSFYLLPKMLSINPYERPDIYLITHVVLQTINNSI